ncbi:MAG: hypothetical protein E6R04_06530 [Spirochaetes bacterium]|nr:MAG: hypothetical protein E6R04_06530 [Spirochaetota bacterium]
MAQNVTPRKRVSRYFLEILFFVYLEWLGYTCRPPCLVPGTPSPAGRGKGRGRIGAPCYHPREGARGVNPDDDDDVVGPLDLTGRPVAVKLFDLDMEVKGGDVEIQMQGAGVDFRHIVNPRAAQGIRNYNLDRIA